MKPGEMRARLRLTVSSWHKQGATDNDISRTLRGEAQRIDNAPVIAKKRAGDELRRQIIALERATERLTAAETTPPLRRRR